MNRNLLIINLEFPPIGGPGVQRVLKFVRYLPREGWTPTVICGDKSTWHDINDDTLLRDIPGDVNISRLSFTTIRDYSSLASAILCNVLFPLQLFWNREKIRRDLEHIFLNLFYYLHPEPLLSWVYLASKKAIWHHKKCNFKVVLTSGPPHITHLVGFILRQMYQVKWVADFRDPWVDGQIHGDRVGISRRLDWLWERLVLRNADRIISVSPSWTKLLAGKLIDSRDKKVHVVYNGYDPGDIPENTKSSGVYSDALRIHYNGTIQGTMLPDLFFKALTELKREEPDIHKRLECTFTGLPTTVTNLANNLELGGIVRDVGPLSHRESLEMSVSSDVLLLILNDVDKTVDGQITGKVYEYVATGKNILAIIPQHGDLHAFLKDYHQCYIVSCADLGGIIETLKLLMTKKGNGQLNSYEPPSWIRYYSRQAQTKRLAGILDNLFEDGS